MWYWISVATCVIIWPVAEIFTDFRIPSYYKYSGLEFADWIQKDVLSSYNSKISTLNSQLNDYTHQQSLFV